jgi:intein-encoded DNA endonuclease-like protein
MVVKHFIRGVFDADGCVFWRMDGKPLCKANICTASLEFAEDLQCILPMKNSIKCGNRAYYINFTSKETTIQFYNYLYDGAIIFLERKKLKFLQVPERRRIIRPYKEPNWARGERGGHAKLSEKDVINILKMEISTTETAKLYGISPSSVCDIRNNRTWKHISRS